jgi:hypothetical protein
LAFDEQDVEFSGAVIAKNGAPFDIAGETWARKEEGIGRGRGEKVA